MENAKAFPFITLAARVVVSTVACHTGGRERAGKSLDGGWDPSLVNGPRSAEKKFMDLLKQVEKVYGPPMHFTLSFSSHHHLNFLLYLYSLDAHCLRSVV